jgi:hypothetical protein
MPRRFFRKFALNRERLRKLWFIEPFDHLLHNPDLWGIRRRSVVPAFSLGLFIAFMPIPGHPLIAALLAIPLRVNVAIATVTTFISNPLTMGPLYYSAYWLGRALLGLEPQPFEFELSVSWLGDQFLQIWQPMVLGCVLLGSCSAFIGYVALDLLWRASIADYLAKRRKRK